MDAFVITGGRRLKGTVRIAGAKNAALPLMAAALMAEGPVTLSDVPHLSDIENMARLLRELGCEVEHTPDRRMRLHVTDESNSTASYKIVSTMRASICVLGPLLAKRGECIVSMPGGCAIGDRPIDLHLRGLKALGAEIELNSGNVTVRAKKLKGGRVFLGGPFGSTVLGTINVMSAAALADGQTLIEQAACEPEVADVAKLLNAMGAKIHGAGTPRIIVDGVNGPLKGVDHTVIADRIDAGTWMMMAAITNGELTIENCPIDALMAAMDTLGGIGVTTDVTDPHRDPMRATVTVSAARRLEPVTVTTQPHPGFPTDLQAQVMALLSLADGNSIITEKIYPERFLHVAELARMGANLYRQGPTVMVTGVRRLIGAPVMASDLRASAGLVMAGLAAKGVTTVNRVYHIDRGYEKLDEKLRAVGAEIERINVPMS